MLRSQIREFHYIVPIENVPSILKLGILSHNGAKTVPHRSIALQEVQNKRAPKPVRGRGLHDYANVYFTAHNPMLSKLRALNEEICVLLILPDILDLPNVVLADCNAASSHARFFDSPSGLVAIDYEKVFDPYWTRHDNQAELLEHKSRKCAEALVPERIHPRYITEARVSSSVGLAALSTSAPGLTKQIDEELFF